MKASVRIGKLTGFLILPFSQWQTEIGRPSGDGIPSPIDCHILQPVPCVQYRIAARAYSNAFNIGHAQFVFLFSCDAVKYVLSVERISKTAARSRFFQVHALPQKGFKLNTVFCQE